MKHLVLLSGGLKSASAAMYQMEAFKSQMHGVFFSYGQRNLKDELESARAIAKRLGFPLEEVSLPMHDTDSGARAFGFLRPDVAVETIPQAPPWLVSLLISWAFPIAQQHDCGAILVGATNGGFMPLGRGHINALHGLFNACGSGIVISAPYLYGVEADIVKGIVRFAGHVQIIQLSNGCLMGSGNKRCRVCLPCKARSRIFAGAKFSDPDWSIGVDRIAAAAKEREKSGAATSL